MNLLDIEEIIRGFEFYLNERGLWSDFREYIESKGYKLKEFGMTDD